MTFNAWYKSKRFFHACDDKLEPIWDDLVSKGFSGKEAAAMIEAIMQVTKRNLGL
jgi:hypothetical protein